MEAKNLRVLIVEDHEVLIKVLTGFLNKLGVDRIDSAKNWQSAIEHFIAFDYQLIFMDIGLPTIHGFDIAYFLRRLEKKKNQQQAVIVALTGYPVDGKLIDECHQNGLNYAMQKPYKLEDIFNVLKNIGIKIEEVN